MNTKVTLGVVSGLLALMLLVIASRRKSAEVAEQLQSSEQTVAELEQQLSELSQTVSRQSLLINQLRAEPLDPKRLPEILKQLKQEERMRLAGFLTPEQLDQYSNRSSQSVQVMSFAGQADGDVVGGLVEGLNLSVQMAPEPIGTSSIRMTVNEAGEAIVIEESEIIFEDGEPPLPPFPPPPPE